MVGADGMSRAKYSVAMMPQLGIQTMAGPKHFSALAKFSVRAGACHMNRMNLSFFIFTDGDTISKQSLKLILKIPVIV